MSKKKPNTSIDLIPTLTELYCDLPSPKDGAPTLGAPDRLLSGKISLWKGDITTLDVDAIVNAANETLLGGGGIDGAIHRAAGDRLLKECRTLGGCPTGEAKITKGYNLPARHVIHTVGPQGEYPGALTRCYKNSLDLVKNNNLTSVAFCCVSTGIYGYDNLKAAHVALQAVGDWLRENYSYASK
ncbi:O-acetyl-ADP-ribose deacetylase macrod1, partial [Entomortierella beljakovae]